MNSDNPFISVIIPVYNGGGYIEECLRALGSSLYRSFETIVVDDASTDNTAEICRGFGAAVIGLERQSGPAAARNEGAKRAAGEILLFVDADVVVTENTLGQFADNFIGDPDISAAFGSYDDSPKAPDFISQYRNLLHHFVHQRSYGDADTFWAGCGAVRRKVFSELGGFDGDKYPAPSIEDIELGYRMRQKGYRITLDKGIEVKHLKHWHWRSMIRTDIFNRALPWSKLIIETGMMPSDMNLSVSDRMSTVLAGLLSLILLAIILGLLRPYGSGITFVLVIAALAIVAALLTLNRGLYGFFLRKRGLRFTLLAIPMHFLYYLYCGASFAVCWIENRIP
ncbi:MAG: glycosyltransferase [Thermodesulfobacteriota bacterium]